MLAYVYAYGYGDDADDDDADGAFIKAPIEAVPVLVDTLNEVGQEANVSFKAINFLQAVDTAIDLDSE